jgi:hypothetical protein
MSLGRTLSSAAALLVVVVLLLVVALLFVVGSVGAMIVSPSVVLSA